MLLFFRNETGFGGNNGFTDFKRILGIPHRHARPMRMRCSCCRRPAAGLLPDGALAGAAASSAGCCRPSATPRAASCSAATTRCLQAHHLDAVGRDVRRGRRAVRAAGGHHQPRRDEPANSIEIAIWAAVGGRATLIGPIVGAFFVNGAKSWFTVSVPGVLAVLPGRLFIVVTLFLPRAWWGWSACAGGSGKGERDMTPDLMEAGAERLAAHQLAQPARPHRWRQRLRGPLVRGRWTPRTAHPVPGGHHRQLRRLQGAQRLSLTSTPGELRCIIGPNGAGKTTMMDVITGKTRPDSRQVFFGSRPSTCCADRAADRAAGIGRKFQKPTVFEQLTVFENLELA
jgi:hypothetical protein